MLHIEQILHMLRVHDIQDVDTVLMSTLLICDTVVWICQMCVYISFGYACIFYIKQVLSVGNSVDVKTVNFNS